MKVAISALLLLFFLFFSSQFNVALAASPKFNVSFDVTYTVQTSGNTHVVFNGSLQNASDGFYASSYTFQTGFNTIDNVYAHDGKGQIIPQIKNTDAGESIMLLFNIKATSINQIIPFSFSFDTPNVAKKAGNIWEVNIPGIANINEFTDFNVHLQIPQSFGIPAYIKPQSVGNTLDYSKEALGASGISLAFGKYQSYTFILHYHLKNKELFPADYTIALPPSTGYQDVYLSSLTPSPRDLYKDKDGNWLAVYKLLPSQKIEVVAQGNASIYLLPKVEILTPADRTTYLRERPYWEQSDDIKKLAQVLQTPKNIYDYVVGHLNYDFSRVVGTQERLGAQEVLKNPLSAVCLEFTDLFIALSRASGIPAREIDGYAFTQNPKERPLSLVKDVLHAWPEYYDDNRKAWIMVDPTWANTTKGVDYFHILDFDHFAFAIKGAESTFPIPAGGYKITGSEKDVYVSFGTTQLLTKTPGIIKIHNEKNYFFGNWRFFAFIGGIFLALSSFIIFIFTIRARRLRVQKQ